MHRLMLTEGSGYWRCGIRTAVNGILQGYLQQVKEYVRVLAPAAETKMHIWQKI